MTEAERLEVFGEFDPAQHQAEAQEKWGDTDSYREAAQRTKKYKKEDWVRIKAEGDAIFTDLATLLQAGHPPSSRQAMEVAERHRLHIDKWFYTCPPALHQGLGELYVHDARFQANIDRYHSGLANYARDAWLANAARPR